MDSKIERIYVPMTETGFYILFSLTKPMHGYNIVQKVSAMTKGEIIIAPGTMYGTLSKMAKDVLIHFVKKEDNRKIYHISDLGQEVLELELKRINRLYHNAKGDPYEG